MLAIVASAELQIEAAVTSRLEPSLIVAVAVSDAVWECSSLELPGVMTKDVMVGAKLGPPTLDSPTKPREKWVTSAVTMLPFRDEGSSSYSVLLPGFVQ
jgi:hypothetical protein